MIFWRTLSDICLIFYFLTDHPLYFQRIGFTRFDKSFMSNCDWINNVFWLLNAVLDMMCDIVDLYHLQKEIQTVKQQISSSKVVGEKGVAIVPQEQKDKLKALHVQHIKILLNIARNGVDIPVILHFMGYPQIGSQAGGFFGTISSAISIYNLWGK